ncbi:hypothetical protein D9M68_406040 [compost metagenome]
MQSADVIRMLKQDGWEEVRCKREPPPLQIPDEAGPCHGATPEQGPADRDSEEHPPKDRRPLKPVGFFHKDA